MKIGSHISNCCLWHGCKYESKDCPITTGDMKQEKPCKKCSKEEAAKIIAKEHKETIGEWAAKMSNDELCNYLKGCIKEVLPKAALEELIIRFHKKG